MHSKCIFRENGLPWAPRAPRAAAVSPGGGLAWHLLETPGFHPPRAHPSHTRRRPRPPASCGINTTQHLGAGSEPAAAQRRARPGARPFAEVTALSGPGIRERGSHRISTGCPPLVSSPASCRYSQEVVPRHPSLLRVRSTGSALCRATARSQGGAWTLLSPPAARCPPGRGPPRRDAAPRTHSCAQGPWGQSVPSPLSFRTPAPGSVAPRGSHSVFRPGGQSCAEPGFVGYRRRGRRHPPSTHGFVLPPPGEAQRG